MGNAQVPNVGRNMRLNMCQHLSFSAAETTNFGQLSGFFPLRFKNSPSSSRGITCLRSAQRLVKRMDLKNCPSEQQYWSVLVIILISVVLERQSAGFPCYALRFCVAVIWPHSKCRQAVLSGFKLQNGNVTNGIFPNQSSITRSNYILNVTLIKARSDPTCDWCLSVIHVIVRNTLIVFYNRSVMIGSYYHTHSYITTSADFSEQNSYKQSLNQSDNNDLTLVLWFDFPERLTEKSSVDLLQGFIWKRMIV